MVIEDVMRDVQAERTMYMKTKFHDGRRRQSDRERM